MAMLVRLAGCLESLESVETVIWMWGDAEKWGVAKVRLEESAVYLERSWRERERD